jgi:hypothetical protein
LVQAFGRWPPLTGRTAPSIVPDRAVTKFAIHLGTIHLGSKNVDAVFYEFSTMEISRANGFDITAEISAISRQLNSMNLSYSGPSD